MSNYLWMTEESKVMVPDVSCKLNDLITFRNFDNRHMFVSLAANVRK